MIENYAIIRHEYKYLPSSIESLIFDFIFPKDYYKDDAIRNKEIEIYRQHKDQSVLFLVIKNDVTAVMRCIFKTSHNEKLPIEYSTVIDILGNDHTLKIGEHFKAPYIPCAEVGSLKITGELSCRYRILLALANACEREIFEIKKCKVSFITCKNDRLLTHMYRNKFQFFNKAIVNYGDNKNWVAMCRTSVQTTVRPVTNLEKVNRYTPNMSTIIL